MPQNRLVRPGTHGDAVELGAAPRLYQRAFDILAVQIENGVLSPGMPLRESGVAAQFGISRAPARRALAELERSGLVEKSQGRGYTVRTGAGRRTPASASRLMPPDREVRLSSLSSWERIYADVEDEIIARISFADWRVNEAELARFYGVSRTVARDVMSRLQQRGLVRKDERSRWYAPALTPDHISELYELRWILEPVALIQAVPRLPQELLARMRQHLEHAIANAGSVDGALLDELEQELHIVLLGHCGNRALMQAITPHQSLLIAHRFLYRWTPRLYETEPFLPEHAEVVERLDSGFADDAAEALKRHLRLSLDRAMERVDVIARKFDPEDLPYLTRLGRSSTTRKRDV